MTVLPIIGGVLDVGMKLVERIFPDPAERDRAKIELLAMQQTGELNELQTRMQGIVAEAQSESWLTRSWRPITMLCFLFLIMNNLVLTPWLIAAGVAMPQVILPSDVWTLLSIGIGGYVLGRSGERITSNLANATSARQEAERLRNQVPPIPTLNIPPHPGR